MQQMDMSSKEHLEDLSIQRRDNSTQLLKIPKHIQGMRRRGLNHNCILLQMLIMVKELVIGTQEIQEIEEFKIHKAEVDQG